jgi:predicted DNA-binding transcriptional regulator AlpA
MSSNEPLRPLLKITDVAEILGISRSAAYDLVRREGVSLYISPRGLRVDEEVLRDWIASRALGRNGT